MDGPIEVSVVFRGEIVEFAPLQVRPEVLDGIENWGVGWKVFEFETGIACEYGSYVRAAVARPAIPDHDDLSSEVPEQLPQECGDGGPVEGPIRNGAEVKSESAALGRQGEGGDHRDFFAVPASDENLGRLASGGERAADQRAEHQAAFVDEDNGGPLASRPF
jgi:hypothetical protein